MLGYAYAEKKRKGGYWHYWHCICDCGKLCTVKGIYLARKGEGTKSCGCLWRERVGGKPKHKMCDSRLYQVWEGMRSRCNNPNTAHYDCYGGRGIKICIDWEDFMNFYDWAIQNSYDPDAKHGGCTLDRIDNNGNYEPDNCRWVDMKTQSKNRRPRRKKGEL